MDDVTLAIYNLSRNERLDVGIDPQITSVRFSTAINRGYDQCQIGLMRPEGVMSALPEPIDVRAYRHAELWIGGYLAFEGRVMPVTIPTTAMVIQGYWSSLSDSWFASTTTTSSTSGAVIQRMLADTASFVTPVSGDNWQDPSVSHAEADFDGLTVMEALRQISAEGDSSGNTVDWYVWDKQRLHLQSRVVPSVPDYLIPLDESVATFIKDPGQMYSGVTVEYSRFTSGSATITSGNTNVTVTHGLNLTPAAEDISVTPTNSPTNDPGNYWIDNITSTQFRFNVRNDPGATGASYKYFIQVGEQRTTEVTDSTFITQFGFDRRLKINAGSMTASAAEAIADAALDSAQDYRYSARVDRGRDNPMTTYYGATVPNYAVRAGDWIQIADSPLLMAVSTNYDLSADRVAVDFGHPLPTWDERIRRLQQNDDLRNAGRNPRTGGGLTT